MASKVQTNQQILSLAKPFLINIFKNIKWRNPFKEEATLIVLLTAIGLLTYGINALNAPFTYGDEGIYTAQAWSVLREQKLSPYTYFYDHAPVGWLFIALWMGLTGGPLSFGTTIDGGRVFILILHMAMTPLLYQIARKSGAGIAGAAFTTLLFSVSPLAIHYQRLVHLDNIMMFWVLLSLYLLLDEQGRLSRFVLSGLCFGLALLTKETAVFLVPAMIYIALRQRRNHHGPYALIGWLLPMLALVSWYPLYAFLKEELLPEGVVVNFLGFTIGSNSPHVSLLEALSWQATRGGGGMFNLNNSFWQSVRNDWMPLDPILFALGGVAVIVNLLRFWKDKQAFAVGLLGFLPLLYLGRGGVVYRFYIPFAIAFLCLNLGLLVAPLLTRLPVKWSLFLIFVISLSLVGYYWQAQKLQPLYEQQPVQISREAISWIKQNVPSESMIISPDEYWTDLHEPGQGGPSFPNVHDHWKVALDPAIRNKIFHNDWHYVDYVIVYPSIREAFQDNNNLVGIEALEHAHLVKRWEKDKAYIELWKVDKYRPER